MKKVVIGLFIVIVAISSCRKLTVEDLEDVPVTLLSPPNNHNDSILTKTFWWEELEDAEEYTLQVVSPKFDSIVTLVLDTVVTKTKFQLTLVPGTYQWRVRPENSGSKGKWTIYNLTISDASSLAGQTITGLSPTNNYKDNQMTFTFSWDELAKADSYLFKVIDNSTSSEVSSQSVTADSVSYTFTEEGVFRWSVQAINNIGASLSSENLITVDTTSPNKPSLINPNAITDTIKSFPYDFEWSVGVDKGTALFDSIWIGSDSLFASSLFDTVLTDQSILSVDTIKGQGKMFWKVKLSDCAGNSGPESIVAPFYIQ